MFTSYALPWAARQPCALFYLGLRQSRNTHTKTSKGRINSSLRGQWRWHCSSAAGVQFFLSYPPTKAQVLSLLIFFWVTHASSWLFVCLFWGRKRQLPCQGFKYCHYMPQVGRNWLVGWKGRRGGEGGCRQKGEAGWLPLGPSRPLQKLSALSKHRDLLWVLNRVVLFSSS